MLEQGLVDEVWVFFRPHADYSWSIRRSIGVPGMDTYFQLEAKGALGGDDELRPASTAPRCGRRRDQGQHVHMLARRQLRKTHRLRSLHRVEHPPPQRCRNAFPQGR
ncbi:hypothetical protein C2845_PM07G11080 [Panicum miliaceum]|uniref:Uncharacterized protein n=1 Tax=Panicum miliaceum TaxID=4540 RepID=A0A3L6SR99_PANMI|nr:hypothetical protein C2845_PM07G11080 [Panicum miliaceum]